MFKRHFMGLGAIAGLALASGLAVAQSFPAQSVRIISPFPAGSGPDVVARMVGEKMNASLKQSVIIDPRPGANGFIAAGAVKQAAPTGYDLFLADVGHLAINPSLFKKLPYDPKADFVPVGGLYRTSFFIVVGANSPYKTAKDLIAAAAANPGKLTYGSNSVGSPLHLGSAQIESAAGIKMLHVPFKEISQMYGSISSGDVDWGMASIGSAGALMRAGKLRFIAIADDARSAALPDVPTLEEAGGPKGIEARAWVSLVAPKGTPAAVVEVLNRSLNDALKQPDVIEKMAGIGFLPLALTPAALTNLIDRETRVYADMVKRTGASVD
jgi:tripartite-type tricarboxylate transporter receptor subunit TctC